MHRFFLPADSIGVEQVTFPPGAAHQIGRVLRLRCGETVLVLDNRGQESNNPGRRSMGARCFRLSRHALDARVERLARLGILFEHAPRNQPWMWREARLRDPSGNIIFLYKAGEARRAAGEELGYDEG